MGLGFYGLGLAGFWGLQGLGFGGLRLGVGDIGGGGGTLNPKPYLNPKP